MFLCSCAFHTSDITPVGPDGWEDTVQEAIDIWEYSTDCEVANIGYDEGNNTITLIDSDSWPHDSSYVGWTTWKGDIEIAGNSIESKLTIVLHELGHRMGLVHSSDSLSIMDPSPEVEYPSHDDILNVRAICY